jgi:hypothetical protein
MIGRRQAFLDYTAVCPANHYRPERRAKAEATVERGRRKSSIAARDWRRETRNGDDRGAPGTAARRPSIVTEYMAGSTLPQLTEPHQQNANWRSKWVASDAGWPLGYTKLPFRDDCSEPPR